MKQRAKLNSVPPMGERLIIIKNGIQTALPYQYAISLESISIRAKSEKRAFAHGGTLSGDGYVDSRKIKISLDIKSDTQVEHDYAVNELLTIFMNKDYKLVNGRMDSYYNVASMESIKQKWQKGFKNRWSDLEIGLLLTDPFRYAVNSTVAVKGSAAADKDGYYHINLFNPGSVDTPLKIKLVPTSQMSNIEIIHMQSGRQCKLKDSLLIAPHQTVIDSRLGTVFRDEDNAINAFSGQFLSANVGQNTYKVKCENSGGVSMAIQARWLI